jgi:hypothetical protein
VKCCVFFAVGTEFLNIIWMNFELQKVDNEQISPNAALPRLITKFKIVYERSKTLLNFSPCSTLHLTLSTSKCLTFTKPTSTRRTSGHCLGTFVAANLNISPPPVKSSAYRYSPPLSLLSLSFELQGVKFQNFFCFPHFQFRGCMI